MTQPTAGWYANPAGGTDLRWWDGAQWTESTTIAPSESGAGYSQPAQGPADRSAYGSGYPGQPSGYPGQPSAYPGQPSGYPGSAPGFGPVSPATPASTLQRNRYSAITVGIAAAYVLLAFFAHFVFLGILPLLFTYRAFQAKEPYAVVAAVVAAACIVFSIYMTVR